MSASNADDRIVSNLPSTTSDVNDDPLTRLFIDQTLPCGMRLLAMAEPVHRSPHGFLTAATALIAFEEAFAVAAPADVEIGLERAFTSANAAVRAANRATSPNHRGFAGITAVVINGADAIMGIVAPGQVLIIQDNRLYGMPDLASWQPGFTPSEETNLSEPLGLNPQARPLVRRTRLAGGDQFVLGSSAVGRVLANGRAAQVADLANTMVIERLEEAIEASGIDGAYAAWIRVDADPVAMPVSGERMQQLERIWRGERAAPAPAAVSEAAVSRGRHAIEQPDRAGFHDRMIAASERLLGRRELETLPLDARRRAEAPLGVGILQRYTAPGPITLGPSLRCRLPRGPRIPLSKRPFLVLLLVGVIVASSVLGYNVRQARADKQDNSLSSAQIALERVTTAETPEEAQQYLEVAQRALDAAQSNGADEQTIAELRDQAMRAADRAAGVSRLSGIVKLGVLPAEMAATSRLVFAAGQLYLLDAKVYVVDADGMQLMPVLTPGEKIDKIKVGEIVSATVDGATLIVTDGKSLFFRDNRGRWSAEKLANSGSSGWKGVAYGAYQGNFYVLNRGTSLTIRKFSAKQLDAAPSDWLAAEEQDEGMELAVDMVVDGSIHVLTENGVIYTLHKGDVEDDYSTKRLSKRSTFVGVDGGTSGSYLFVLEVYRDDARVLRYERGEAGASAFQPVEAGHIGFNLATADALAGATDFVVDENGGAIYFVTAQGLYRASLP